MKRIVTTITIEGDEESIDVATVTTGHAIEDWAACQYTSISHAVAVVAKDSPLGFEKFLELLCKTAIDTARRTRRAK